MLSRVNSMVWMEGGKGEEETAAWAQNNNNGGGGLAENKEGLEMGELSTFKSMLEAEGDDWYMTNPAAAGGVGGSGASMHVHNDISFSPGFAEAADNSNNNNNNQLLLQAVDSSASCSPTPASIFSNQVNYFLQPKSFISGISNNPLEGSFDLGCESGYLESAFNMGGGILSTGGFGDIGTINSSSNIQFGNSSNNNLLQLPQGSGGFGAFGFGETSMQGNSLLFNRSKILKPLDNFASLGTQPTLFQKRAALRKNLGNGTGSSLGSLHLGGGDVNHLSLKSPTSASDGQLYDKRREISEMNERKRKSSSGDDIEDLSMDGSNLNYDSDEQFLENGKLEESGKNGGSSSHANSTVTGGDPKGKKKGLPAKNLMAERRRRKKLNDRLYMLRSVVPKISKMDRASILGDAIEYLKELLQNINDLHNELESIPSSSNSLTPTTTGLYPLTPTAPGLSTRIKEELCPSAFASPLSSPTGQPARVEVRLREGRAVNIHMFCGRRPGLLLSTMRAMDNLGLDVQQAVISCFNGFALDVFRAEQCREGQELNPDQIKAVLLDSAGYHGMV